MLFLCISGNRLQCKRQHPSRFMLFLQVIRGSRWKRKPFGMPRGIVPPQHEEFHGRGQCLYFKHSPDAEWSLERECEGCWHPQPVPAFSLIPLSASGCPGGLSYGMTPWMINQGHFPNSCSPTDTGPNVGKSQRDLCSKFCPQKGTACSWGRISLLATLVFAREQQGILN